MRTRTPGWAVSFCCCHLKECINKMHCARQQVCGAGKTTQEMVRCGIHVRLGSDTSCTTVRVGCRASWETADSSPFPGEKPPDSPLIIHLYGTPAGSGGGRLLRLLAGQPLVPHSIAACRFAHKLLGSSISLAGRVSVLAGGLHIAGRVCLCLFARRLPGVRACEVPYRALGVVL